MKALTITTLVLAGVLLLAAPEARAGGQTTDYVDLDTVVVIYKNYYYDADNRMDMTDDDVQSLTEQTEWAREMIWRGSNFTVHMNVLEYLVMERTLYYEMLSGAGGKMFYYWSEDGETSVESDLRDAGYTDGDLTAIVCLWAFDPSPGVGQAYGGECWPIRNPNAPLGDSAFISIGMGPGLSTRRNTILHEYSHSIDTLLDYSGAEAYNDAMHYPDNASTYGQPMDGALDFMYGNLDGVPTAYWLNMYSQWATTVAATDKDQDLVIDSGDLPVTEATLGTSVTGPKKLDFDEDGLTDYAEAQEAGFWAMSDATAADTDGDGTDDGSDAEPLITCPPTIAKNTSVTVNGAIGGGEYTWLANYNGTDSNISVDIYAAWTDGALYVAADVTDDYVQKNGADPTYNDNFRICIDADSDGWWLNGGENYRIWCGPTPSSGEGSFRIENFNSSGSKTLLTTTDTNCSVTYTASSWLGEIEVADADLLGVSFSVSTELRLGFYINDKDPADGNLRDSYDIFTGATLLLGGREGPQPDLYCVEVTLVN